MCIIVTVKFFDLHPHRCYVKRSRYSVWNFKTLLPFRIFSGEGSRRYIYIYIKHAYGGELIAKGLAWIYETRVNNVLTTPVQLCKLAVLTAPFLRAKLITLIDRQSVNPAKTEGGKKRLNEPFHSWRRRKEETANRNRTLVSHPLKQRFHGTLFSYLVIGARLKQVKIIFRSGLNRVLTIDFEKGGKKKRKTQSREEKRVDVVATSRANNPLKYSISTPCLTMFLFLSLFLFRYY